jgi:predicted Zn-dependent protease
MSTDQRVTLTQAMDIAVAHHQAGRFQDAENIYRQILANQPDFPAALHMLGVIQFQTGRRAE